MQDVSSISKFEILSILATLVLGGLAIWLSVFFYKLSSQSSTRIKEASDRIGASVDKLESLFDKLYADTFSVVRDTVSDMRNHILRTDTSSSQQVTEESKKRADEKIDLIRTQLQEDVSKLVSRQNLTDSKIAQVGDELRTLISQAIAESRKAEVEAREETIRDHILRAYDALYKQNAHVTLSRITKSLKDRFTNNEIASELFSMKQGGIVKWDGRPDRIAYDEPIKLLHQ